ncbi:MAG: TlpA family protein disulfide reductase [Candidatus Marinamargulisbacteria bacterium]
MNFNNKKILIGFIVAFILGLNVYNIPLKGQDSQSIATNSMQYEAATKFKTEQLNSVLNKSLDAPVNFNEYNKVIISFWATWCPSCRLENKIFNKILKKTGKELLIIGISVDKSQDALDEYLNKNKLSFPVLKNTPEVAKLFDDIVAVPTHYIIDVKTETVRKSMGVMDESEINNIIKEKL